MITAHDCVDWGGGLLGAYVDAYIEDLKGTLDGVDRAALQQVIDALLEAREHDRQVFLIGNGGSAATASHMACDLGKGTINRTEPHFRRFRAISLTDNTALLSAIGNDLSFEDVFVEQLRAHLNPRDVVIAISASGNSPNVLAALAFAQGHGALTVGLLGFGGGRARALVDIALVVASRNYGIAEDFQVIVQHILTQHLRRALAGPPRRLLFLDRDGVINQRPAPHTYVTRWDEFRFVDGVAPTLRTLGQMGFSFVVVTNQQGIGKGIVAPEELDRIHLRMAQSLAAEGVTLEGIFTCPHLQAAGCVCRKPRPGLIHRALNELHFLVHLPGSLMVGDSEADIRAGRAAGLRTIQVGGTISTASEAQPTHTVERLAEIVPILAAEGQVTA
jgi:D-sedoheptulose 7-phosphate isomerase